MKCSIIIPCYNGGKLLDKNLVLLFKYCNNSQNTFEIIVINDGSTDNTLEILEKYKSRITLLSYKKKSR